MVRKCLLLCSVLIMIFTLAACAPAKETPTPEMGEAVTITDPNLEAAIRDAIGKPKGLLYTSDLKRPLTVRASNAGIADLTGLEYCTSLEGLYLDMNKISDISLLANLTNLKYLDLTDNNISDVSPLASLTNLFALKIGENQISDISPLVSLINLTGFEAQKNQISDISPLASMTKLGRIWLYDNQISDISALAGLTELYEVRLHNNNISDIAPLAENTGWSEGNLITLANNPLSETSKNVYIPQIEETGTEVHW